MPSLRDYRDRISSVKSTKKITSAMKMVAAAKLKKAQDQAEASQPYARAMAQMLSRVAAGVTAGTGPKLLVGTGRDEKYLLTVVWRVHLTQTLFAWHSRKLHAFKVKVSK